MEDEELVVDDSFNDAVCNKLFKEGRSSCSIVCAGAVSPTCFSSRLKQGKKFDEQTNNVGDE
jgi:hypothetical protein